MAVRSRRAARYLPLFLIVLFASGAIALQYAIFNSLDSYFQPSPSNEYGTSLKRIVTMARNAMEPIFAELRAGTISREDGLRRAADLVRSMVYEDGYGPNYVFLTGYDGSIYVQPFDPSLEGTNQWDLRDANGVFIARELPAAAQSSPGGAFVTYLYPPPGKTESEEKLSFVLGLPELGALVGTGMYVKAFSADRLRVLERARLGSLVLMVGTAAGAGAAVLLIYAALRRQERENARLAAAENAVVVSERNLKNVFDLLDEAIVIHDAEGRVLDCNEGFLRMHGLSREEALGLSVFDLSVAWGDREKRRLLLDRLVDGSVFRFEETGRRSRSGALFEVDAVLKKASWNDRLVFITELRDVSDKKAAERALLARTAALERFERLTVGRELRMIELKKRIAELEGRKDGARG